MKHLGRSTHLLRGSPQEATFARLWVKWNGDNGSNTLAYLLDPNAGTKGKPPEPCEEHCMVAATVIQWLGSPVGQSFLEEAGYARKAPR